MKNWFEGRAKKPRFKAKKNKQSISFPQNITIVGEYLKIPKVGLVKAKITQEITGQIKTVTISVNSSGKYYAAIGLDLGEQEIESSTDGQILGIDLGLKDYVTCHSFQVKHPKWLKRHQRNLRQQQKQLARRKKTSQNIRLEGIRILGLGHSPHRDGVRLQTCSEAAVDEVSTTLVA